MAESSTHLIMLSPAIRALALHYMAIRIVVYDFSSKQYI